MVLTLQTCLFSYNSYRLGTSCLNDITVGANVLLLIVTSLSSRQALYSARINSLTVVTLQSLKYIMQKLGCGFISMFSCIESGPEILTGK